jgi:hypothetical protein
MQVIQVIGFSAIEGLPLRVSGKHSCEPLPADSLLGMVGETPDYRRVRWPERRGALRFGHQC